MYSRRNRRVANLTLSSMDIRRRTGASWITIVVALTLLVAACGGTGTSETTASTAAAPTTAAPTTTAPAPTTTAEVAEGPIRLGGILQLTGQFSAFGLEAQRGIEVGLKQVNDAGGVLGRQVEVDLQDDATDTAETAALFRRFASDEDIVGVVGSVGSPAFLAVQPIQCELGIPWTPVGAQVPFPHDDFCDGNVRTNVTTSIPLVTAILQYLAQERGIDSMAVIYDRANDSTAADRQVVVDALEGFPDIELTGEEAYAAGDTDFAAQLDSLLRNNPSALWLASANSEFPLIMQQARARGYEGQFVGGSGLNSVEAAKISGEDGVGYLTFFPVDMTDERPVVQDFVALNQELYGDGPVATYTGYGYDSFMLLVDAIRRAGTTDREAVATALGETTGLELVTGTYSFEGKGDNTTPSPLLAEMIGGGEFSILGRLAP